MPDNLMPMGNSNTLEDLATMFLANAQQQQQQPTGPKMIVAGGQVLGEDVSGGGWADRAGQSLQGLASNYLMAQKMKRRNEFMKGMQEIMNTDISLEDTIGEDGKTIIPGKIRRVWEHNQKYMQEAQEAGVYEPINRQMEKINKSGGIRFVNQSSIPEDMEIVGYDQKGNPMIRKIKRNVSGEKLDIQKEEKKKQQEAKSELVKESAQDTLNTIAEIEKGIDRFGLTGNLPAIPGTERATWIANINKLLSGRIINLMTSMKEASRTGATGFGQLSEKELKVLQEASTALKRNLPPEAAQKILNEMKIKLQKIVGVEAEGTQMPSPQMPAKKVGKYSVISLE